MEAAQKGWPRINRPRGRLDVRAKAAQRGTRHQAGVGLGFDAVRSKVGDDGRGPPISLRGAAVHSRPSWAAVSWAALGRKARVLAGCEAGGPV
jgi:hypothetical protein